METNDFAMVEWLAWRRVSAMLVAANAVTASDAESPAGLLETDGQRLYEAIRQWGEALVNARAQLRAQDLRGA